MIIINIVEITTAMYNYNSIVFFCIVIEIKLSFYRNNMVSVFNFLKSLVRIYRTCVCMPSACTCMSLVLCMYTWAWPRIQDTIYHIGHRMQQVYNLGIK